ncbi:hypothetical protein [Roseovarius sp. EL26]|uniref:hypothetical protein n=1 Tax=Roseovarius sp. EL26 TaxID=2126672 RepID=UPI0013C4D20C|nr:hypothetical protein [Roseovarius sp. EL26]
MKIAKAFVKNDLQSTPLIQGKKMSQRMETDIALLLGDIGVEDDGFLPAFESRRQCCHALIETEIFDSNGRKVAIFCG